MQNKKEFMKEFHYIKDLVNKIELVTKTFNLDFDSFGEIIDHHVILLSKAFNIPKDAIDLLYEMIFTNRLEISVYDKNNILCEVVIVTENNLYEELMKTQKLEINNIE